MLQAEDIRAEGVLSIESFLQLEEDKVQEIVQER